MGCGECQLLRKIKQETMIEHLIGVDVDVSCLECSKFIIKPLISDHLMPVREKPMVVQLYEGSVADYDDRLSGADLFAFVEVIEHLNPEVLQKVPETIFASMKPNCVIITTPNSEFNELFKDFKGFRHWDHKFEWTRQEFQSWCEKVTSMYPYTVKYSGVGLGPKGKEHLGHCTQIAIFYKKQEVNISREHESVAKCQPYKLIAEAVHPFKEKRLDSRQNILFEVEYYNRILANSLFTETDEDYVMVPLEKLLQFQKLSDICGNAEKLREVIKTCDVIQLNYGETAIVNQRQYEAEWSSDSDSDLPTEYIENKTKAEGSNEQIQEQIWD
ncbi:small RNA 2'-O-methyltransferase-like isoform X2 [Antedon mediterranea]